MGTRLVPHSQRSLEERILVEVPYDLWFVPHFPLAQLGGKLDKDPTEATWLQGLYEDIRDTGHFRNPVIVWNHHKHRLTGKQPYWLLRAGSNRVWCAEQLGWADVPALVSTARGERPLQVARKILPRELESHLHDPGIMWCNDAGFGLLAVAKPEATYAAYETTTLEPTARYGRKYVDRTKHVLAGTDDPRTT